jgi:hypothetical protein
LLSDAGGALLIVIGVVLALIALVIFSTMLKRLGSDVALNAWDLVGLFELLLFSALSFSAMRKGILTIKQ